MLEGDIVIVIEEDSDLVYLGEIVTLDIIDPEDCVYKYKVSHPTLGACWVINVALATPLLKALS